MKYKIIKRTRYDHALDPETQCYKSIEIVEYGIFRKGTIFGFWHTVGETLCDSQGNIWIPGDWFDTYEKAKTYCECFHKEHYGDENIVIINTLNL